MLKLLLSRQQRKRYEKLHQGRRFVAQFNSDSTYVWLEVANNWQRAFFILGAILTLLAVLVAAFGIMAAMSVGGLAL